MNAAASHTDVGRKRRVNQDSFGEFPGADDGSLLLVCCDGMGGHSGGEIASQLSVAAIGETFRASAGDPGERLASAFHEAHRRVREHAERNPQLAGMGTTGVALFFDGKSSAWVAHVGDSRAYRLRDGKLEQLTADHSLVAELVRMGKLTPEQAARHPHNELARAIGASDDLEVDCAKHDARDGDRWLLCSDGLWNMVSDGEIGRQLYESAPTDAVRRLVERANEAGGLDNVTVQVLALGAARGAPAPADDGATEQDRDARLASARLRAASRVDETRAISASDANVEEIWARAQAEARAAREHRIRQIVLGAAIVIALSLAAFLLLGRSVVRVESAEAGEPANADAAQ
jgi:protein phosphatase